MNNVITLGDIFKGDYGISQKWGANKDYYSQFYIYGVKMKGHEGVDFLTPAGTPIIAPFDGIVLREDFQPDFTNYGRLVVLWDPVQRAAAWWSHLSEETVNVGQQVRKGQWMGKTGNTGNSSGPHLHFGLVRTDEYGNRINAKDGYGGFIDPLDPKNVKWELGVPPVVAPETDAQKLTKIRDLVKSNKSDYEVRKQILAWIA